MADRVGPILAPPHSTPFESVAYDRLARRLHRAGTNLPAVSNVTRIIHAVFVVAEVLHLLPMHLANRRRRAPEVQPFQPLTHRRAALTLQTMAYPVKPRLSRQLVLAIERLGLLHQMLLGMVKIENAHRLGKEPPEELLQAHPAVRQRDVLIGRCPADLHCLAVQLSPQRV